MKRKTASGFNFGTVLFSFWIGSFTVLPLSFAQARVPTPQNEHSFAFEALKPPSACFKLRGGGLPEPINPTNVNRFVELADEELYVLEGFITTITDNLPYYRVNLDMHSWLATKRRRAFPFYRINVDLTKSKWSTLIQKPIRIIVRAHTYIEQVNGNLSEKIWLEPISDPNLLKEGKGN